ncbi:MAG: 4-hydroxybenzoate octaprenyltransferase [Ignavibacteriaceae bacterium]|nr:4-hydroxybenzoate octaprenyltransferase [Ignavibacteriaceae bacterium]
MRPELPFSAGLCVVMGQIFSLGEVPGLLSALSGFFSIFLLSAAILVLNDYFDIESDKINAPHRPIPSGAVTPAEALIWAVVLFVSGIGLSYLMGMIAFATALAVALTGFLYNRKYKKSGLPGNLMVSFSVGMTFIYGGISVGMPFNHTAWFFGLIAALIDLGEEIAADAMDAEGDKLINSKSIAIRYGRPTALRISSVIFASVIVLSAVPFYLGWFAYIYLIPVGIMVLSIAYCTVMLLKSKGDEGRKHIRNLYLGATAGILVCLVMRISGV